MDIFQSLLNIDDSLIDWILRATPSDPNDPSERQAMQEVLASRSDVEKALNTLVAFRLKLAAAALADDTQTLEAVAKSMSNVGRDISTAQTILDLAGQAVSIAAQVIAAVTL